MKKILVTGAFGQLGRELQYVAAAYPDFNFLFTTREQLPVDLPDRIQSFFATHRPDWCINCAAYTAVDIRVGSPTYGRYVGIELSSDNKLQFLIPPGFAHGFSVLSPTAEVAYKCDTFYNKESEAGIRFDDPQLNIDWQLPADKIIVSAKDRQLPPFQSPRR